MSNRRSLAIGIAVGGIIGAGLAVLTPFALSLVTPDAGGGPRAEESTVTLDPEGSPSPEFPTAETSGVPAGWTPEIEATGDLTIWTDGAVVEDLRLRDGVLYVRAANVTLRRLELVGARVVNEYGRQCFNGLRIEDSTFLRGSLDDGEPAIQAGGYTLTRVKIDGPSEGIRVGEQESGCGPVTVADSWVRVEPPDDCVSKAVDWHGDGLQGYHGSEVTVRNTVIQLEQVAGCQGTAAFFYPDQANTRATVEHVLVSGGGYVFRLGTAGSVTELKVVDGSWDYAPVDVRDCRSVEWGPGNAIVSREADGSLRTIRSLECAAA